MKKRAIAALAGLALGATLWGAAGAPTEVPDPFALPAGVYTVTTLGIDQNGYKVELSKCEYNGEFVPGQAIVIAANQGAQNLSDFMDGLREGVQTYCTTVGWKAVTADEMAEIALFDEITI